MGSAGGCDSMIGMLRRRLMSNMAKAKNIATGTVNAGNSHWTTTSISAQTGFRPDHVAVFIVALSGESALQYHVLSVYDGSVLVLDSSTYYTNISTLQYTVNEQGFTIANVIDESSSKYYFTGTYRYVAWQE